jgi:undecaprenyl diphosphate synthase
MSGKEDPLLQLINRNALPAHIAVIMDGNGRWARKRGLPRIAGHRAGINAVREVLEGSAELGVSVLTLYAYLNREIDNLDRNNIRFQTIGRTERLEPAVREELERAVARTKSNTGLKFLVALNYGGRTEILDAVNRLLAARRDEVDEGEFSNHLYTAGLPDPDLLIRTSGEMRVSNFLLWQIAYTEIYVTETLWPDFGRKDLYEAIIAFQKRERRYGGLGEPAVYSTAKE